MSLNPNSKEFNPLGNVFVPSKSNLPDGKFAFTATNAQSHLGIQGHSGLQNHQTHSNKMHYSQDDMYPADGTMSSHLPQQGSHQINSGGMRGLSSSTPMDVLANAQPFHARSSSPAFGGSSSGNGEQQTSFNPLAPVFKPTFQANNVSQSPQISQVPIRSQTPTPQAYPTAPQSFSAPHGYNTAPQGFNPTPQSYAPPQGQPYPNYNMQMSGLNPSAKDFVLTAQNQQGIRFPKSKFVKYKPFFPNFDNQPTLVSRLAVDAQDHKGLLKSLFLNENLRYFLMNRQSFKYQLPYARFPVPSEVNSPTSVYHSIYPLFSKYENSSVFSPFVLSSFKAVELESNEMVALTHVADSHNLSSLQLQKFTSIKHPNIIGLQTIFTTTAFNHDMERMSNNSNKPDYVLVYDYIDYAESLYQLYLVQKIITDLEEKDIWSYLCQIFSALDAIHSQRLSYDCMNLRKVFVTPQLKRIHLSGLGVHSLINTTLEPLERRQAMDVRNVSKLIIQLILKNEKEIDNLETVLYDLKETKMYSIELLEFLEKLGTETITVKEVIQQHLGYYMMKEMNYLHRGYNILEEELVKEIENGRLFRLLVKMNFVIQKQEYDQHPHRWTEEGDLYIVRLFFNHLFQFQTRGGNTRHIDWVHVIENLNKLDVGSQETILLASKNEQNILVVSYKEIRECIQNAFKELNP